MIGRDVARDRLRRGRRRLDRVCRFLQHACDLAGADLAQRERDQQFLVCFQVEMGRQFRQVGMG